jgi:ribonucleoside-triphosphate reductase
MAIDPAEQHRDTAGPHPEGLFDAQMSLPLPFVGAPEPFSTVLKRNGREETFERVKIANAIFRAAQSIGGDDADLADSLARAVTIYLTKQLGSHVPTVDHIHDAVERVLISMAHIRTAFAYARYRDRRARIRRLREGDMRLLLGELEEAQRSGAPTQGRTQGLFVRTSDDTIISWNRERIVEALVLETGLDAAMAGLVAAEVEQQLEAAEIKTLTTSLVRELGAARLVAHGLHEYRERHQRLGVPLYDCERIIRGLTNATTGGDPVKTDYVLAGAVKKEYALARVYSPHVSEAHLQGAIHLHGLEKVDRLRQALLSPGMIAQFGVGLPGAPDFASPPRNAITFLAQLAKATANFQAHFSGSLAWDAVNYYFAPFVAAYSPEEMAQFAQMIVYEFAYRAMVHGGDGTGTELRLYWTVPDFLADIPAVGVETKEGEAPRSYRDFEHAAQQLAWKLLEILHRSGGQPVAVPIIAIGIDERFFKEPAGEAFLVQAASLIEAGYGVRFYFSRGDTLRSARAHWQPGWTLADQVSINLPRLAYKSGKESKFLESLDQVVSIAGLALQERFSFLEGLLARGLSGPLGLLAVQYGGSTLFEFESMCGFVAVDGLNEAVQTLLNAELHTSEEARQLGMRILERIHQKCQLESRKRNLHLSLSQETELSVGQRFAAIDAMDYPKTAKTTIKIDKSIETMHYSTGISFPQQHGLSPFDLARGEGEFHTRLSGETCTRILLPASGYAATSIGDLLKKLYFQTQSGGIEI